MKKNILFLAIIFLSSCEEKKIEFMQSKAIPSVFLIKNRPLEDSLLRKQITLFLIKNPLNNKIDESKMFYRYTWDTEYFIDDDEYDGFGAETLSMYSKDILANFYISKCKNDTTKLVGRFHFYGLKGADDGVDQIDTLIYKCN
jgi:hypothetical protein